MFSRPFEFIQHVCLEEMQLQYKFGMIVGRLNIRAIGHSCWSITGIVENNCEIIDSPSKKQHWFLGMYLDFQK